ncbi:RNA polymerase factor sigma-54 [Limisalsivibrio acetivorans]|uniref:RNA polymerase factor sigma-54 n=1 Tax=Limisalsivibrio acetivorans TaxID=1304888 RepID=UPI0003B341FF|nr:RNA polymerase factor sigma-54 [Limisalsivibrio acetivorans]
MAGKLNLGLQAKLSQKLLITPQMKQSLSILQMPITELVQELGSYLEENPVLEENQEGEDRTPESEKEPEEKDTKLSDELLKVDWDEYYRDSGEVQYNPSDDEGYDLEKFVSRSESLHDHLMFQLRICGLGERAEDIGEYIIGSLDENGYFVTPVEEIAAVMNCSEREVEDVLEVIKGFEPAGIASSTLKECIASQLEGLGTEPVYIEFIAELLENYEQELCSFQYDEILQELSIEQDTFEYLIFLMRKTDPRPGLSFQKGTNHHVVPDVYIVRKDEEFDVVLNEEGMPSLRTSAYYLKMLQTKDVDAKTKEYLEEKVKNAVWLIKSLNKRQKAIYRVVRAIIEAQREFFENKSKHLKPLKLRDIAEVTELHESTVSRVTSGKYAMTAQGVVELKSFFVKGLDSSGGDVSTDSIKEMINSIVEQEPKESPYSDQKIVEILQKKGIKIARRTVAKYRDELSIPTKSQRKRARR